MKKSTIPPPTEAAEQQYVIGWAYMQESVYPELRWLHAVPNCGYRSKKTAVQMHREGVKAGVSDLCLPAPRRGYNGLYIEMKRVSGGKESKAQAEFRAFATKEGYYAVVCKGAEEAIKTIKWYLGATKGGVI